MTMRRAIIATILMSMAPAGYGQTLRRVAVRPAETLAPAARAIVDRFDADTAAARAVFSDRPITADVSENLSARVALEQALRAAVPTAFGSAGRTADHAAAVSAIWDRIIAVDAANTEYLKSVLPADGWFTKSRDGEAVASDAWLIVQHSPDDDLQRRVVERMAALVRSGEANGPHYALLHDRTELSAGRPQTYGSQMTCATGRRTPLPLADPLAVDRLRAEVGLEPLAEYLESFPSPCALGAKPDIKAKRPPRGSAGRPSRPPRSR